MPCHRKWAKTSEGYEFILIPLKQKAAINKNHE